MRRELLLIAEMMEAGTQAHALVAGIDLETLKDDRQRRAVVEAEPVDG